MDIIAISYENWWEPQKRNISQIELWRKKNRKKSIMKHVVNKNKKIQFEDEFILNDSSYSADIKIFCEKFNDFFLLMWVHPYPKRYPCKTAVWNQHIKAKVVYSLYLEPVTVSEMKELIKSLKSSVPGYDNVRSSILKLSLPVIYTPLTCICNLSLQGVFPDELKIANVIPSFKSDDPELFNNYRPVSLLCTVSKIFEKIMYSKLLSLLDKNKILFSCQFEFRKKNIPLIWL